MRRKSGGEEDEGVLRREDEEQGTYAENKEEGKERGEEVIREEETSHGKGRIKNQTEKMDGVWMSPVKGRGDSGKFNLLVINGVEKESCEAESSSKRKNSH